MGGLWGLNSAVSRSVRLLAPLSIYALSVITSTLPKGSPIARTAEALGCVRSTAVFVAKVSGAPRGGVGGTLEGSGLANLDRLRDYSHVSSSESLLLDLLAARIDVCEENERHSSPHAVLVGPTGCRLVSNEPKHSSPKRFTGAVCSHIQRAHT